MKLNHLNKPDQLRQDSDELRKEATRKQRVCGQPCQGQPKDCQWRGRSNPDERTVTRRAEREDFRPILACRAT
jgi:hypothetical protein